MENKVKALRRFGRFDRIRIPFAPYGFERLLLAGSGLLALTAFPLSGSAQDPDKASIAKLTQQEEARRQQNIFSANQALDAGDVFLQTGDLTKAEERYAYALKSLQSDAPNSVGVARARNGLAQIKIQQAQALAKGGDFPAANGTLDEAVQLDAATAPQVAKERRKVADAQALAQRQRMDPESTTNNPVITPEFRDQVATVQRLLFEGDRFFETGQYDRADERYRQALVIDQYNKAARQKLDRLARYKEHSAEVARQTTRAAAMYDVDRRWTLQELPTQQGGGQTTVPVTESNIARLNAKLNQIKIDSIAFDKTPVDDAIRLLGEKAKQADPEHIGVNFVLKLTATQVPAAAPANGAAPAAATAAPAGPSLVTLSLNNVSLADILRLLTQYNNLKYKVEEYAIYILPASENSDVLVTRTFVVPTGFFSAGLAAPKASSTRGGSAGVATTVDSVKVDVKQQLTDQGVDFPTGAAAAFLAGSSRLVVKNTAEQMDRIDALLQAAGQEEDPQVEIETKFAEFTDDALKALQFNWLLARGSTPGIPDSDGRGAVGSLLTSAAGPVVQGNTSLRGVPDLQQNSLDSLLSQFNASGNANSNAQFFLGMVIGDKGLGVLANLISQVKGVDLLSAPKITTKNRVAAKIEVNEQMTYPNQFTAPTYNTTSVAFGPLVDVGGPAPVYHLTSVVAPPTPSSFDKAAIGVTMDVTPVAYADRRIDLEIKPDVTDFEGFIDYGSTIRQGETTSEVIDALQIYHIRQPVFNNRKITTKLQVVDGQTIVMGGLVREDTQTINDKVPVLGDLPFVGRAFQSKIDQRTKRNLMIFITARIVRSTGRPKFAEAELAAPSLTTASTAQAPVISVPHLPPGARSDTKGVINP